MFFLLDLLKDKYPKEEFKAMVDKQLIDPIEDYIAKTETKWDDFLAIPVISLLRYYFGIEDND